MRVIRKKLTKRKGFSLAETLIAILILLMVSSIVAAAIPTASKVYMKTVDAANAQVLLSTVMTELRNELSDAVIESPKAGAEGPATTITYINGNGGYRELSLVSTGNIEQRGILLTIRKLDPATGQITTSTASTDKRMLVNSTAATGDLVVSYTGVSFADDGVLTFTGLSVTKMTKNSEGAVVEGPVLANCTSFAIRGLKQPNA